MLCYLSDVLVNVNILRSVGPSRLLAGPSKGKLCHTSLQECRQDANLPSFGHKPISLTIVKPDLWLPSQPQNVTTLWPTPNYAAW